MRAGRLRHPVNIERPDPENRTATGAAEPSWSLVAQTYAAIEPIKGREYFEAGRVNEETTHLIVLRYLPGLTSDMRVNWNGRLFDLQAVINKDERNRELECTAIERTNS